MGSQVGYTEWLKNTYRDDVEEAGWGRWCGLREKNFLVDGSLMGMIEMEVNGHVWNVFWKILIKNYRKAIMYNTFSFGKAHCCEGRNLACQFPSPSITWRLCFLLIHTCRNSQEITAAYFLAQNSFLLHFSPFGRGNYIIQEQST